MMHILTNLSHPPEAKRITGEELELLKTADGEYEGAHDTAFTPVGCA